MGALEILQDILDVQPELGSYAPLMEAVEQGIRKVVTRGEATREVRLMARSVGADPQHALYSGRIGGATQIAK